MTHTARPNQELLQRFLRRVHSSLARSKMDSPPSNDSVTSPVTVVAECLLATREVGRCLYHDVHASDGHLMTTAKALRRRVRDETQGLESQGCGEWSGRMS